MGRLSNCFSFLLFCFLNIDMCWMLFTLSHHSSLWFSFCMHLLIFFTTKKAWNSAQNCHIQTCLLWFHLLLIMFGLLWECKWISTSEELHRVLLVQNICKTSRWDFLKISPCLLKTWELKNLVFLKIFAWFRCNYILI